MNAVLTLNETNAFLIINKANVVLNLNKANVFLPLDRGNNRWNDCIHNYCILNPKWIGCSLGGTHISFFFMKREIYLPEGQCRISISIKYTMHGSKRGVTCG